MMKLKTAYKILIGLNILFSGEKLMAQTEADNSIQIRTIAIAPYGIENASKPSGIYYDLANLLFKDLKLDLNHKIYPYARIINELKTGRTDLTIMFKYKELEDHVIYIAPLPALANVVIGLKGSSFKVISDLEGKSLAYLRGAKFSDEIDMNTNIEKSKTMDFSQSIKMLVNGRVDAIIGPMEPILNAADSIGAVNIFGKPLYVSERVPWLQISKKSKLSLTPISNKIRLLFEDILNQGELKKLQDKYGSSNFK
ncbi:MAG: transporter substrate-binding domain-containing protein [Oceanospirillaceae bacterium]